MRVFDSFAMQCANAVFALYALCLTDLSKREVQALMFAEMLAYRPSAGSINDIPPSLRPSQWGGGASHKDADSDDGDVS